MVAILDTQTCVNGADPQARFHPIRGIGAFWLAPDLEAWAQHLIEQRFEDFPDCVIAYLWKESGGGSGGQVTLGKTKIPSGELAFYSQVDFIIWLAADHVDGMEFTNWQLEALLYHELCHVAKVEDDKGGSQLTVKGHEFEGFASEIEKYGFWRPSVKKIARAVQGRLDFGEKATGLEDVAAQVVTEFNSRRRRKKDAPDQVAAAEEPEDLPTFE